MIRRLAFLLAALPVFAQQQPPDTETQRWWHNTEYLASDAMEGRDTGSAAYERAAQWTAQQFRAAGLETRMQPVPMHEIDLDTRRSTVAVVRGSASVPLRLLHDINTPPRTAAPLHLDAPLVFLGYGTDPAAWRSLDLKGKALVYFNGFPANTARADQPRLSAERVRALSALAPAALVPIQDPFSTEPWHWPLAYAHRVTLRDEPSSSTAAPPSFLVNPAAMPQLLAGSGQSWDALLTLARSGAPLPTLALPSRLQADLVFTERDIESPNVLAVIPGTDPVRRDEYVVFSAHLDGYGHGEPVNNDDIYNGALDDAAYVSTLVEFARLAHEHHDRFGRSILLAAFTGEEKGLLGSAYFAAHPTIPRSQIVADVNLDQLRPIFPLKALTAEGLDRSTLGVTARQVAGTMNIEIRPDREPERQLFRRADHFNFDKLGIPAIGFVFAYDPNTPEEKTYRDWYARRYHQPADDTSTPINWNAAARFNRFINQLVTEVANASGRPTMTPTTPH